MTIDRDLRPLLTDWMREDAILPDDLREVVAQLPQTRQRRHRWWFTIPALTWRYSDMFNATRAVVAVLLISLGTGLVIATVADREPDPVVPPAADAPSVEDMARFTYTSVLSAEYPEGSESETDYGMALSGGRVEYLFDATDDRVDGSSIATFDLDYYESDEMAYPITVVRGTEVLTNEGGTWEGTFELVDFPGTRDEHFQSVLSGTGAYEGLTAVFYGVDGSHEGVIIPGTLPELPTVD